jgi:hypothetical protein
MGKIQGKEPRTSLNHGMYGVVSAIKLLKHGLTSQLNPELLFQKRFKRISGLGLNKHVEWVMHMS